MQSRTTRPSRTYIITTTRIFVKAFISFLYFVGLPFDNHSFVIFSISVVVMEIVCEGFRFLFAHYFFIFSAVVFRDSENNSIICVSVIALFNCFVPLRSGTKTTAPHQNEPTQQQATRKTNQASDTKTPSQAPSRQRRKDKRKQNRATKASQERQQQSQQTSQQDNRPKSQERNREHTPTAKRQSRKRTNEERGTPSQNNEQNGTTKRTPPKKSSIYQKHCQVKGAVRHLSCP